MKPETTITEKHLPPWAEGKSYVVSNSETGKETRVEMTGQELQFYHPQDLELALRKAIAYVQTPDEPENNFFTD